MENTTRAAILRLDVFLATQKRMNGISVSARRFHSLSYRFSGCVSVKTEAAELLSEADSITYVPAGTPYQTEVREDTQMAVVHFECDRDIAFRNPAVIPCPSPRIRSLFERLAAKSTAAPIDFTVMALTYELLSELEAFASRSAARDTPEKILLARAALEAECTAPDLSISALAERLGISTTYLRREFRRAYGKSPLAYLRELRLRRAQSMLASDYLSVSEIALQCGYSSASYFTADFRASCGESPSEYRRRIRV